MENIRINDLPEVKLINPSDLLVVETSQGTRAVRGDMARESLAPVLDVLNSMDERSALSANMGRELAMDKADAIEITGRKLILKANGQVIGQVEIPDDSTVIVDNLSTPDSKSALSARQGMALKTITDTTNINIGDIDNIRIPNVHNVVDAINVLERKPDEQRPVVNNLYSTDTEKSLSAAMGKELATRILVVDTKVGDLRYLDVAGKRNIVDALNYSYLEAKNSNTIVNNLVEGGSDKALSAQMGKELGANVDALDKAVGNIDNLKVEGKYDLVSAINAVNEKPPTSIDIIDEIGSTSSVDGSSIRLVTQMQGSKIDGIEVIGSELYAVRNGYPVGLPVVIPTVNDNIISDILTYSSRKIMLEINKVNAALTQAIAMHNIVRSPDGGFWEIKVSNTGVLSSVPYTN